MESGKAVVQTLQFRNGIYQGRTVDSQPQGIGLFLDDFMRFYVSEWQDGQLHGRTVIFSGHGKYLYGQWREGLPHGFNIFRSGDIVLLGHFNAGELSGEFIVVFERQNMLAVVSRGREDYIIKSKFEFLSEEDIKKVSETLSFSGSVPHDYFSLIKFVKMSFIEERLPIRLAFDDGGYRFGFDNGLAICFDDDNFVKRVGWMNGRAELTGLGGCFTATATNEQGNFGAASTIKYKTQRPNAQLKALLKVQHRRSIHFVNGFIDYEGVVLINNLDDILRYSIINKIVQDPLNTSQYSEKDFNDSLDYYPKNKQEGQRLQLIREVLYRSVGRVGAEMVPISRDPSVKPPRNPGLPRQMHYTPPIQLPDDKSLSLGESHKEILEAVLPYKYETVQKRVARLRIQRQIEMKGPEAAPQVAYERNHSPNPSMQRKKEEEPKTTASRHYIEPEIRAERSPKQPETQSKASMNSLKQSPINPFFEDADQLEMPTVHYHPTFVPQKLPADARPDNVKVPPKKRTPGRTVHFEPLEFPSSSAKQEDVLPKFNGGNESPHHQMDISHEDQYMIQNPSSRRFIPVVHESKHQYNSKPVSTANNHLSTMAPHTQKKPPSVSPPKKANSYLELHRKEIERVTTAARPANAEGTIRTISRSPLKVTTVSPSRLPIHVLHQTSESTQTPGRLQSPSVRPATVIQNPQQLQTYPEDFGTSNYFKHQQQRNIAAGHAVRKYDYVRNM